MPRKTKVKPIFHNGGGPLKVPGFGHDIDLEFARLEGFRHGVNDFRNDRLLARELAMLAVMDAITDKPRWQEKVFDEAIVGKWRTEATAMPLVSPLTWDWCLRELRDKAVFLGKHGFVKTLETGSVCAKRDGFVDEKLRDELLAGVKPLLEIGEAAKDWHPNSNEQVLNLVHPSLFPLVYGRTQVLPKGTVGLFDCVESCGKGMVAPKPRFSSKEPEFGYESGAPQEDRYSERFQWLPAEVKFKGDGVDVEFTSYINNLHPVQHAGLYSTISEVVSKAIPMWNEVLVKGYGGRVPQRIKACEAEIESLGPPTWIEELPDGLPRDGVPRDSEWLTKVEEYLALPDHPDYDTSTDDVYDEEFKDGSWKNSHMVGLYEAVEWKSRRLRRIVHPEPGADYSYDEWKAGKSTNACLRHDYRQVSLEEEFKDQGLQIIVKLASVELTPEKPEYGGGNWHLEGMMNEHIVATVIYYYDVENVSESLLDFRMEAELDDRELTYEQDDHEPLARIFGVASLRDEPAVQNLGTLKCKNGRMLAFPNTLQHRVKPFKLVDPSRAGHRRFLVLWLIDPNYRVMSTANVPPQQHDWVAAETVEKVLAQQDMAVELKDMIREYTDDYPMDLETAKALRLELMQERTKLMPAVERGFEMYNLCEH